MAVGLWDSSFKNAFHTLSYRFAAVILVILYSRGKGKELKDAEQGCIADTLTIGSLSQVSKSKLEPWLPRVVVSIGADSSSSSVRFMYSYLVHPVANNAKKTAIIAFAHDKSRLFVEV